MGSPQIERRSTGGRGQARTRLARAAVVDAARTLFVGRGYGATTIDVISDLADVPVATVYRLFSSKRGILKAILDVSIVGDEDAVPLAARPAVRALLADADPRQQIEGLVAIAVEVNSRVAPIYHVLVSAAGNDPDAGTLLDELTGQRQEGQRLIARNLSRTGALRPGVRERDAADLIHALVSPEMYRLLVLDRRWKPERYRRWLTSTLRDQLLPPPEATP